MISTNEGRPPERSRKYLAGVLTGYAILALTVAINLWLTPFTLRLIDREEYAIYVFGNDLLMWLVLLDFGMTAGLRAQVAQLTGSPDPLRLNRLASTTFFAQLAMSLLMIAAGIGLGVVGPNFFQVPAHLRDEALTTLILLALAVAVNFASQTFASLLIAHQQIHIDNLIRIGQLVLRTVITVVLLVAGWGVVSLAVAALASVAFFASLSVVRCYMSVHGWTISLRLASPALLWHDLRRLNVWYAVGGGATALIHSATHLVAARVVSLESVTTLTLTGRVYTFAFLLLAQLTTPAQPGLGQLIGLGDRDKAYETYRRLLVFSTGLAVVASLSLWSGNPVFVARWVGAQNYGGAALDSALMVNLILVAWVLPNRMVLIVGLRARAQALTRSAEALLALSLSIWLAGRFGLVGVVVATVVAATATSCWQLPRLAAAYFERGFRKMLRETAVPPLLIFAALLPVAAGMRWVASTVGGFVGAFVAMSAVGLCGLLLLWRLDFYAPMGGHLAGAMRVHTFNATQLRRLLRPRRRDRAE